jgi:hypothetical protein
MAKGTEAVIPRIPLIGPLVVTCEELPHRLTILSYGRGPAKGYTEALEARLIETEEVLLKVLSTINVDQLSTAFIQANQHPTLAQKRSSTGSTSTETGLKAVGIQRKAAIEYWHKFPLNTPEDVGHWLADRDIGPNIATPASNIGSEQHHPNDASDRLEMEMRGDVPRQTGPLDANMNPDNNGQFQSLADRRCNTLFITRQFGDNVDHSSDQHHFMHLATQSQLQNAAGPAAAGNPELTSSPASERSRFAFSAEFKNKFLW